MSGIATMWCARAGALGLVAAAIACSSDEPRPSPGPTDGSASADAARADAGVADAAGDEDAAAREDASTAVDPRGFPIRRPRMREVPCMDQGRGGCDGMATATVEDADFVCTLRHGARDREFVYVQSTPVRVDSGLGLVPLPVFERAGAWLSDGSQVTAMDLGGIYDIGGGHQNDSMTVDLGDTVYRYYHSSFGFGFRKCQEMDCLQTYAPGASTPTTDGCTRDRTLPVVCVRVAADGTVPPLVDTFMRCPGDT